LKPWSPPTTSRTNWSQETNAPLCVRANAASRCSAAQRFLPGLLLIASLCRPGVARAETWDVGGSSDLLSGTYTFDSVIVRSNATLTLRGNPATGEGVTIVATTCR